ncbi:MAG TPA: beta-glucosidase BglX [Bryobacteraceae bacterium]|nr:beta-glucosidase BglX [Bryobacteraceae bacterium]
MNTRLLVFALTSLPLFAASPAEIEAGIHDLIAKMTIEEKLGQMSQSSNLASPLSDKDRQEIRSGRWGSYLNAGTLSDKIEAQRIATKESRLGIPLIFGRDVIHGFRTVFPIPLGEAASWDPDLVRQAAHVAAVEASATGIHWVFAPMVDIARDPRWGRIAEGAGEDPYLGSAMAAAMVRGFQGPELGAPGSVAACVKHYVGYGAAEGGRDYNTAWIPEVLLRNVYLPPFRAARDAGAATYMSAFQDLNGVPASGNEFTLRHVLRDEWHFDGFVVSDWNSIAEMINWGYAADDADAAAKGVLGGVDMEMVSTTYYDHLKALIDAKRVDMRLIDEAVANILRVKFRLGLFDRPIPAAATSRNSSDIATRLAEESAVLLKNAAGVLPLSKSLSRVAVIGPLADSPVDQMGTWVLDGKPEDVRTPLAALRGMLGESRVAWARGLQNPRDDSRSGFAAAVQAARSADAVVMFLGEDAGLSGEARSRAFLNLPGAQDALVDAIAATGKPIVGVIMAGRPLTFHAAAEKMNAVLYAWHPGTMGGAAIASLLFGDATPSGRLPVSFPRTVSQIPVYYNHMNTGRPPSEDERGVPLGTPIDPKGDTSRYIDVDVTPEYPFGYGLSYTTFQYSNLKMSGLTVSVDIANTGSRAGDETAQLYIRQLAASITRPVRELKGFQRVKLVPGEKRTVQFTLTRADLGFWNAKGEFVTEPGQFQVWIAPDSAHGPRAEFRLE